MKERADKVMADRGIVASRSQAKSLIEKGDVTLNGNPIKKASELIDIDAEILVNVPLFVGRGAFKLQKALEEFKINPKNLICMDVGASTGGFTEVLLLNHAQKVYAIDVGHGQLVQKLREDSRVVNMENTNIREVHELVDLIELTVMDVSFISITKVLENLFKLMKSDSDLIALVKPQFEAGKERLPKDGVIKEDSVREAILKEVITFATSHGWQHLSSILSPIEGKTGNKEYLVHFKRI